MTEIIPECPADPRPNGEPYFIDAECPEHGVKLEQDPESLDDGFHDEFVCSECGDGVHHVDWPESRRQELLDRVEAVRNGEVETIPLDDIDV